jgi:hypothetical protein
MTEVRFTRDYRGKLTREVFYSTGDVVGFDDDIASRIVAEQAAEYAPAEEQPAVEDAPKPKRGRKKPTEE